MALLASEQLLTLARGGLLHGIEAQLRRLASPLSDPDEGIHQGCVYLRELGAGCDPRSVSWEVVGTLFLRHGVGAAATVPLSQSFCTTHLIPWGELIFGLTEGLTPAQASAALAARAVFPKTAPEYAHDIFYAALEHASENLYGALQDFPIRAARARLRARIMEAPWSGLNEVAHKSHFFVTAYGAAQRGVTQTDWPIEPMIEFVDSMLLEGWDYDQCLWGIKVATREPGVTGWRDEEGTWGLLWNLPARTVVPLLRDLQAIGMDRSQVESFLMRELWQMDLPEQFSHAHLGEAAKQVRRAAGSWDHLQALLRLLTDLFTLIEDLGTIKVSHKRIRSFLAKDLEAMGLGDEVKMRQLGSAAVQLSHKRGLLCNLQTLPSLLERPAVLIQQLRTLGIDVERFIRFLLASRLDRGPPGFLATDLSLEFHQSLCRIVQGVGINPTGPLRRLILKSETGDLFHGMRLSLLLLPKLAALINDLQAIGASAEELDIFFSADLAAWNPTDELYWRRLCRKAERLKSAGGTFADLRETMFRSSY